MWSFCISFQGGGSVLERLLPKWSSSSSSPVSCRGSTSTLHLEFPTQTWTSALPFHLISSPSPMKYVPQHVPRAPISIHCVSKIFNLLFHYICLLNSFTKIILYFNEGFQYFKVLVFFIYWGKAEMDQKCELIDGSWINLLDHLILAK